MTEYDVSFRLTRFLFEPIEWTYARKGGVHTESLTGRSVSDPIPSALSKG